MSLATLTLPAGLLRQSRTLARECGVLFEGLCLLAAAEAMRQHADMEPVQALESHQPRMTVEAWVPSEAVQFVAALALVSGLNPSDVWHVIVAEFLERALSPGLERRAA